MDWYVPMTIVPGVSLIIISTSTIILSLNSEISLLESQPEKNLQIIQAKLSQLKRVSLSIVFQYVGVFLFLISGILKSMLPELENLFTWFLLLGVLSVSISIAILINYSLKAVKIRQKHLQM